MITSDRHEYELWRARAVTPGARPFVGLLIGLIVTHASFGAEGRNAAVSTAFRDSRDRAKRPAERHSRIADQRIAFGSTGERRPCPGSGTPDVRLL